MSGRFLLDTNIIIAVFADEEPVKNKLAQANEQTKIAGCTQGELPDKLGEERKKSPSIQCILMP